MSSKLNVGAIVVDHLSTLRDAGNGKVSVLDIGVFYLLPILLGGAAWRSGIVLETSTIGVVATCLSVFAGLLLNLLLLLHTILSRVMETTQRTPKTVVMRHLHANISYGILTSVIALVGYLIASVLYPMSVTGWPVWPLVFVLTHFVLTLGVVLKRTYLLVDSEIK